MLQIELGDLAIQLDSRLDAHHSALQEAVAGYAGSGDLLRDLGDAAREIIIERTAEQHIDAEGRPFAPYTPEYAIRKRRLTGYSGPPNLRLSGRMLDEIELRRAGPLAGSLSFRTKRSAGLAAIHNEGRRPQPRRRFFGIGRGGVEAVRLRDTVLSEFRRRIASRGY